MVAARAKETIAEVNRELWLLLSLFVLAALLNSLFASNRMVLGFYVLPTLFSAYHYGRRHATLTAMASVLIVVLVTYFNPQILSYGFHLSALGERWTDIAVWGGVLVVTAYAMGTLYDRQKAALHELRQTYHGILIVLQQFTANDKYTHNHSYRVSVYATRIAAAMGLDPERIEDIRAAALLHDIGKLEISRDLLYKAARLTEDEFTEMKTHVSRGVSMLAPVGGSLRRVLPIVLAHHDRFDGSGYHPSRGEEIPLEARVLAVADAWDTITSDRPYRKATPSPEARDIILSLSGRDFDPAVVKAFLLAYQRQELEMPEALV